MRSTKGECLMSTNKRAYTINIHSGKEVLHDIIDDLALQVIRKNVDDFNSGNPRIKKIHPFGRAV